MSTSTEQVKYKANDFKSEAEPRWCPGCEDYAILKAVQTAMAKIGRPKNEHAVVSFNTRCLSFLTKSTNFNFFVPSKVIMFANNFYH